MIKIENLSKVFLYLHIYTVQCYGFYFFCTEYFTEVFNLYHNCMFFCYYSIYLSFRGALPTKNLENINVDVHEILRFALNDNAVLGSFIHS